MLRYTHIFTKTKIVSTVIKKLISSPVLCQQQDFVLSATAEILKYIMVFSLLLWLGIRVFDSRRSTDQSEAKALSFKRDMIDIYSNSWGPGDMGWQVAGPGLQLKETLKEGTRLVCGFSFAKSWSHSFSYKVL